LEHVNPPTDWDQLEDFIRRYQSKGKLSASGGGDCLYKYDEYKSWWDRLFGLADKYGMLVDVHTREKFMDDVFWEKTNRCVFSSDWLPEDRAHLKYLLGVTQLRITHLVTQYTTRAIIEEYLDFQRKNGCQLTVKQLIGYGDNGKYAAVRALYPEIYALDGGDYNIYYMPDNTERTVFLSPSGGLGEPKDGS